MVHPLTPPFHTTSRSPRSFLWPPSLKQSESGIRTLYDLSKGIALFGVFVPLVTFTAAWYLEGRHGSSV